MCGAAADLLKTLTAKRTREPERNLAGSSRWRIVQRFLDLSGGRYWTRTSDPCDVNQGSAHKSPLSGRLTDFDLGCLPKAFVRKSAWGQRRNISERIINVRVTTGAASNGLRQPDQVLHLLKSGPISVSMRNIAFRVSRTWPQR